MKAEPVYISFRPAICRYFNIPFYLLVFCFAVCMLLYGEKFLFLPYALSCLGGSVTVNGKSNLLCMFVFMDFMLSGSVICFFIRRTIGRNRNIAHAGENAERRVRPGGRTEDSDISDLI